MTGVEHGLPAIAAMFAAARAAQRAAFLPYYPIGYPSYTESLDAIIAWQNLELMGLRLAYPLATRSPTGRSSKPPPKLRLQTAQQFGAAWMQCGICGHAEYCSQCC